MVLVEKKVMVEIFQTGGGAQEHMVLLEKKVVDVARVMK